MAKIHGSGLAYLHDVKISDEPGNTRSVYQMWMGDRVVFLVSVVNDDPELLIQIGRPDAETTGKWHVSTGHAGRGLHPIPSTDASEVPDGLAEHVDGVSLQAYIYPRLPLILVNMYVPKLDPNAEVPDDISGLA